MAKTMTIDGVEYVRKSDAKVADINSPIKICILQRGWAMVGKLERKDDECKLHNASVIRFWGTNKGLGEIAKDGPTSTTKLDKCNGIVEFDWLTVVAAISCDEEKWASSL